MQRQNNNKKKSPEPIITDNAVAELPNPTELLEKWKVDDEPKSIPLAQMTKRGTQILTFKFIFVAFKLLDQILQPEKLKIKTVFKHNTTY